MFFQVSYKKKEVEEQIKDLVGAPYSLLERLRMGGSGSQRYLVSGGNESIVALMETSSGMHFCNIELRTSGILIWFRIKIDNYVLAIPYHLLTVLKSDGQLRIFAGEWKVVLSPANNRPLDNAFILKMLQKKNAGLHGDP